MFDSLKYRMREWIAERTTFSESRPHYVSDKPRLRDQITFDFLLNLFAAVALAIPLILFTLVWFGVSFLLFYGVTKVIFFS
jgi:fatty-acid desaturase